VGGCDKVMPLTFFQREVAILLASSRSEDSYLAGGAALHIAPNSMRYSNDLDYFHDSVERVTTAFETDSKLLTEAGYSISVQMNQRGFIRAVAARGNDSTKIEWAHDSAWRFLPPVRSADVGMQLHPIDLAVNKMLALVGRDEPRDFLDILFIHREILPLATLLWAAVGKDPGFTPMSMLEIARRRGRYRPEDFSRLHLAQPIDLTATKKQWLAALNEADSFIRSRPHHEIGCLYYSKQLAKFVMPDSTSDAVPHFGSPGGVLPVLL
jgi:hypothetical protein